MNSSARTIHYLFVKRNLALSGVCFLLMSAAFLFSPGVVSLFKVALTVAASVVYSYTCALLLRGGKDYTEWTWTVSHPAVMYCAADSVDGVDDKLFGWMNWLFYLACYFFLSCIWFRVFRQYRITRNTP